MKALAQTSNRPLASELPRKAADDPLRVVRWLIWAYFFPSPV